VAAQVPDPGIRRGACQGAGECARVRAAALKSEQPSESPVWRRRRVGKKFD
jgi:hypothetical protein